MLETLAWTAFLMGLISACSLPLGALTTRVWTPDDRATAILMSFGGGALLAALTIDLVGSAVDKGHFNTLAVGAILGGILFELLNQLVNDYGGFLRKASTTLYHLRRQEHRRLRRIAGQIGRAELLADLSPREYKALAPSVRSLDVAAGSVIFDLGDPADAVYILASGALVLKDPRHPEAAPIPIAAKESFGWLPCVLGAPASHRAVATEDVSLWVIPKAALDALAVGSPELVQRVHRMLRSPETLAYLTIYQGMTQAEAQAWLDTAAHTLLACGRIPPALPVRRERDRLRDRLPYLRRFPLVHALPPEEQDLFCGYLIYKSVPEGVQLFHQGQPATRMFILAHGQVSLIDPQGPDRAPLTLRADDALGGSSLLTGARHTMTAVATAETAVWELRSQDLEALLRVAPAFAQRLRAFVRDGEAATYLVQRQHLSAEVAERWCRLALRALDHRQPLPPAARLLRDHQHNAGAPLAIYLGITLDGIPESLVIGASLIHANVSLSLIVGLFLSNYPEALSSSVGMRAQGMSFGRVLLMWSSLMLITGLGAAAGSQFFIDADPHAFALIEGLAAGAMLTMIAETMLPEAYAKGGSVVGLSTLAGFLVAIWSKTLE